MIEQSVSLASTGVVKVPGYEQMVRFGYTKNRGVYRLHVDATGEWEGLTIRAFWHVPDGKDPPSSLAVDGYVAVPASVTAQPGSGCVTFEGSDGTTTMTSADLRYRVSANSGTEDGTEPEPGTPAWQQLVDAVHTDAAAAEQAKTDAQTAAQQAGASAQKAGNALSDTIAAKEDALKAIGDKQTAATQAVDTARDKALKQVEASTEAAQTAASQAADSAGNADRSAQEAAGSLKELKNGIASGNFKGEPGTSPTVTVQDIAGGHRIVITDATGTSSVDVLNGKQGDPGKPGDVGATPELTIGTVKEGDAPSATITGTAKNPVLNLTLKSGAPGKDATVDATLTHEGEAADAKATGDAISAVKSRQNFLIGSETGNPIAVDDAFSAPLCGLTVYGRSTQDGTPTPDAPVPIVSAGDGGSVTVKVTGKNLLDSALMSPTFSDKGISAKQNSDGSYTISGTPTVDGTIILWIGGGWNNTVPIFTIPPGSYYSNVSIFYYDGKNRTSKKAAFTLLEPFRVTGVMYDKSYTINESYNFLITPQIEPGSIATTYAPYREQLLTLPTPTGLPGIPVASGGNYTDSTGQQWVCDEVDFEKGVKVQRVDKAAFDSTKTLTEQNAILATPIENPLTSAEIAAYKALTAYGPDTVVQAGDGAGVKLDYQRDVNIAIKRIEDAVASMTTT